MYNPPEPVSPVFYIIIMLSGGVFATFFGLGLKRLSNNLKVNLSVLFFSVGITVYGLETYLQFYKKNPQTEAEIVAKHMGVSYDTRTKMEVLKDLRDSGVEAFPNFNPKAFSKSNGLTAKKGRIYPLGTISNIITVFDSETGSYPIIETDEHGFNNSKGLYNKNKVDIILTGDSFTEGTIHSNESISAVLRQLNFNAISIGKAANGSLAELAALKEYAEPLEPRIVLWLYYGNDLEEDLRGEMKSSILRKYLNESDYSQNLISRQEEIDDVLKNYTQIIRKEKKKKLLKLTKLRKMINLLPAPTPISTSIPRSIFRDILSKSRQMVSGWNGKMYLVYLPSFERYSTDSEDPNRDFVMQTAAELDIPVIDIQSKVFDLHLDPLSLFPFRISNHYNSLGYRLVAEAIGKRLEADCYVPIKSKK